MAGTKISDYAVDNDHWTELLETLEKQRKGYIGLSLTNYDNSSLPAIEAASYLECAGALYGFSSEEAIGGSPTTANINYIVFDPTPITFSWSIVAPTWSAAKNAWMDAGEAKRYIGECYFATPNYTGKLVYDSLYKSRKDGIPEGIIVAQIPGYFGDGSNGSYTAVSIPLTSKWKACDGSALNDPLSVIFNGAGRYLPNLTDDRFLMGDIFAAIGGIGGANTMDLCAKVLFEPAADQIYIKQVSCPAWTASHIGTGLVVSTDSTGGITLAADVFDNTNGSSNIENRPKYLSCQYIMKVRS